MTPIEKTDWNAIRAEYIGGGISQRKLAAKHGVSPDALMQKANREGWKKDRDKAISRGIARSQQKAAEATADNATIAARIKTKLLRRLEAEIDRLPESIGSEMFQTVQNMEYNGKGNRMTKKTDGGKTYKLKDLTAAYKDLTADMVQSDQTGNELLASLLDLERRCQGD